MQELDFKWMGIQSRHEKDFIFSRRNGSPDWLILCFSTPVEILTTHGIQRGEAGDCIFHSPYFPHYHHGTDGQGFVNDWLFCGDLPELSRYLLRLGLPVNTLIHTGDPYYFSKAFREMEEECLKKQPFYGQRVANRFESLLLELARTNAALAPAAKSSGIHKERIAEIRNKMHENYARSWTVEKMAKLAGLSAPRFAALYKEYFNISPMEELMRKRMQQAQIMLLSTRMSVEEIALACGFSGLPFFSRTFSARTGVSPRSFRQK